MQQINELSANVEADMKSLQKNIKQTLKLKGDKKREAIDKLKGRDFRQTRNLINSLQYMIRNYEDSLDQKFIKEAKESQKIASEKLKTMLKSLQYSRNEGLDQQTIFKNRKNRQQTLGNERDQLIKQGDRAQLQSEQAVKRTLNRLYQMKQISNTVNIQLERQMERLDSIYQELQDTQSTMKRAQRHIKYFARSVYTDKILMVLIVLIIIAIVVVIVLSAMGKIPKGSA